MERILYTWLEVSEMMDERSVEIRSEGARENYILYEMSTASEFSVYQTYHMYLLFIGQLIILIIIYQSTSFFIFIQNLTTN